MHHHAADPASMHGLAPADGLGALAYAEAIAQRRPQNEGNHGRRTAVSHAGHVALPNLPAGKNTAADRARV
jgi:hypothetical protein